MIQNIRRSLTDLLGAEYTAAVCRARAALTGESQKLCAPWPMRRSIFIPRLLPAARRS